MGYGQASEKEHDLTDVLLQVYMGESDSVVDALLPRLALKNEEWFYTRLRCLW